VCPLVSSTPTTRNGTFLITTPDPTAPPAGKRLAATVLPRTATLARCACSFDVKNRPCATFQLLTAGHDVVDPTIVVNQLVPPATAWALVCEDGAAAATSGTSWAIAPAPPQARRRSAARTPG